MHAPAVGTAGTKVGMGRCRGAWEELGRSRQVALSSWRVDAREWEWDSDVLEYKL